MIELIKRKGINNESAFLWELSFSQTKQIIFTFCFVITSFSWKEKIKWWLICSGSVVTAPSVSLEKNFSSSFFSFLVLDLFYSWHMFLISFVCSWRVHFICIRVTNRMSRTIRWLIFLGCCCWSCRSCLICTLVLIDSMFMFRWWWWSRSRWKWTRKTNEVSLQHLCTSSSQWYKTHDMYGRIMKGVKLEQGKCILRPWTWRSWSFIRKPWWWATEGI